MTIRAADEFDADRAARRGQAIAPTVRLGAPRTGAERGDVLPGFAEFATSELPSRVHEALVKGTHKDRLVGHISRDATAIEAREKPVKVAAPEIPKRKRGRPKKGEVVEKELRRLERQAAMSVAEMVNDLPTHCAVGTKRNAKGHTTSWIGYKLHLDVADGDIPISGLLTSASLHDSQAAIPPQPLRPDGQRV